MLIRENPGYPRRFVRDDGGVLLITRRLIIATRRYARTWA
jgi:hypothetical protein